MNNPYVVNGVEVAPLLGRDVIFDKICRALTKPTPDHVSIVGPRYFGKTVLMHALERHFRTVPSFYQMVCHWDLRHQTPTGDVAFIGQLATHLRRELPAEQLKDLSSYLDLKKVTEADAPGFIADVIDSLNVGGVRILLLLDDFDRLARETGITKNLWDYLRSLAQRPNLRLVTSSRDTLRTLIPSLESRTSDFFNIFSPVVLPPFGEQTISAFLEPLVQAGKTLDKGVAKQFLNWTGGVPILCSSLARSLIEDADLRAVTVEAVDDHAAMVAESQRDAIEMLWTDCAPLTRSDLMESHQNQSYIPEVRRRVLVERGYLVPEGVRFRPTCRLMRTFCQGQEVPDHAIHRLFLEDTDARRNLRRLLELRLPHAPAPSVDLTGYVKIMIDDFQSEPQASLGRVRALEQEALLLAWNHEFPGNAIPVEVKRSLTMRWNVGGGGMSPDEFDDLDDPGTRRKILRLASGLQDRPKHTKFVSRPLMLLMDYLYRIGNFGLHQRDIPPEKEPPVSLEFCVTACFAAVSLVQRLSLDLHLEQSDRVESG